MIQTAIPTAYDILGGASGLRALVERFYDYMDKLPETAAIRALHPADLSGSREKLYKFLSGWLGGPNLYWQEFGHPRLRMRHFPFSIGLVEAEQWLLCMEKALDEAPIDDSVRRRLFEALRQTAYHMINRAD